MIIFDAIKDFFPKKEKVNQAEIDLKRIEELKVILYKKEQEARKKMEEQAIKTIKIPPPPEPQAQPIKQAIQPEPQAQPEQQEVTIEELIIATYNNTLILKKDLDALYGLIVRGVK